MALGGKEKITLNNCCGNDGTTGTRGSLRGPRGPKKCASVQHVALEKEENS